MLERKDKFKLITYENHILCIRIDSIDCISLLEFLTVEQSGLSFFSDCIGSGNVWKRFTVIRINTDHISCIPHDCISIHILEVDSLVAFNDFFTRLITRLITWLITWLITRFITRFITRLFGRFLVLIFRKLFRLAGKHQ